MGKKEVRITFGILAALVLANLLTNMYVCYGEDALELYHPVKLSLLGSDSGAWGFYLMQLYPILVVLPAGFSLWKDRNSGMALYQITRIGKKTFYLGKMLSTFWVTAVVFVVPLWGELLLNAVAFPTNLYGDSIGVSPYDPLYIQTVKSYMFSDLYQYNPYLYALLMVLLLGIVSGILGMFTVAISAFRVPYRLMLLLPVYLLLYGLSYLKDFLRLGFSTNYFQYLRMFGGGKVSPTAYFLFGLLLLLVSSGVFYIKGKGDYL